MVSRDSATYSTCNGKEKPSKTRYDYRTPQRWCNPRILRCPSNVQRGSKKVWTSAPTSWAKEAARRRLAGPGGPTRKTSWPSASFCNIQRSRRSVVRSTSSATASREKKRIPPDQSGGRPGRSGSGDVRIGACWDSRVWLPGCGPVRERIPVPLLQACGLVGALSRAPVRQLGRGSCRHRPGPVTPPSLRKDPPRAPGLRNGQHGTWTKRFRARRGTSALQYLVGVSSQLRLRVTRRATPPTSTV